MSTPHPHPPLPPELPQVSSTNGRTLATTHSSPLPRPGRLRRALSLIARNTLGAFAVQSVLGAFIALGWTARAMQREAHQIWGNRGAMKQRASRAETQMASSVWSPWPRWVRSMPQTAGPQQVTVVGLAGRIRATLHRWLGGAGKNLKVGAQMLFNTAVLVLPATAMMQFAWYDGWNNSFNKGYEQAFVGPLVSAFAILAFILVMFHVPFAQARQAVSGDWRRFYDFALIRKLVRRAWFSTAMLAAAYVLLCIPLTIMKFLPTFFVQISPKLATATDAQRDQFLGRYFLITAVIFFPIFVSLHLKAARAYAAALLSAVQSGAISESDLADEEWRSLNGLGLLTPNAPSSSPQWKRAAKWFGTRTGQAVAAVLVFVCWFAVIGQVYVGEFFLYHPRTGLLNPPVILLPLHRSLP